MQQYVDQSTGLKFDYPLGWEVRIDGNTISVFDPSQGVGALQFSLYRTCTTDADSNIHGILKSYLETRHEKYDIKRNEECRSATATNQDGTVWRYWIGAVNGTLILATYNCVASDTGKEEAIVQQIVKSAMSTG